jgi:hypothetical protein
VYDGFVSLIDWMYVCLCACGFVRAHPRARRCRVWVSACVDVTACMSLGPAERKAHAVDPQLHRRVAAHPALCTAPHP